MFIMAIRPIMELVPKLAMEQVKELVIKQVAKQIIKQVIKLIRLIMAKNKIRLL